MKDAIRLKKEDWVAMAVEVLRQEGVDRVKVDPLAKKLGVTRGSFYWHFGKRQDLLDAVLAHWKAIATQGVIQDVEGAGLDPVGQLRQLVTVALTGGADQFSLERVIRAWASTDPGVGQAVQEIDRDRIAYLSKIMRKIGWPEHEAEQHGRFCYYCRTGLYHQAQVPELSERLAMVEYVMAIVAR